MERFRKNSLPRVSAFPIALRWSARTICSMGWGAVGSYRRDGAGAGHKLGRSCRPCAAVANSEIVAIEIVRTLVGSVGLVAAVPATTWRASWVVAEPANA